VEPLAVLSAALVGAFFVVPTARGIAQAVRARDAWAPFERSRGHRGALAPGGGYLSSLRAPGHGQRSWTGLWVRWVCCVGVTASTVLAVARLIW
jgi:hypothetical protein